MYIPGKAGEKNFVAMSVQWLLYADLSLDLVSLVIGCMVFRRSWPFEYKCLFFLNILRVVVSCFTFLWPYYTHSSNHWIYNLFLPLQCAGFLLVFYGASMHRMVRRVNKWLLAALPLVTVICWSGGAPLDMMNTWAVVCFDFLLLVSACLAFVDQMLRIDDAHFVRQPIFWLASGLFFYSVGSIIEFATWEYIKKMLLIGLYRFIAFSGENLLDAGIIGCFVCIYFESRAKKTRDLSVPGLDHR